MGIYLENAHHITIESCHFSNLGTVAVSTGQPLQNNVQQYAPDGSPVLDRRVSENFHHIAIRNCRIHDTGAGGIILTGGDRRTLTPSGNEVSRCEFYRVDERNHTYAAAIKLFGDSATVDHCYFHDLRHMAIWYRGNNHRIAHNLFERVCTYADDMGAICTGRDPASRGTVISGNHFRDILPFDDESQVGAVFLDDGTGGTEIARNFFERTGSKGDKELFGAVFIHGGHGNRVHHNVFLDCDMAVGNNYWSDERWKAYLEGPLIRERLFEEVDIAGPVFLKRYPELKNYCTEFGPRLNKVGGEYFDQQQYAHKRQTGIIFQSPGTAFPMEGGAATGRIQRRTDRPDSGDGEPALPDRFHHRSVASPPRPVADSRQLVFNMPLPPCLSRRRAGFD